MARYIDADKLKEHKFVGVQFERYSKMVSDGRAKTEAEVYAYKVGYNDAIDSIADFEPTADVVEVVRCKDCKHSVKHQLGYGCGMNYHLATNGEWFCADGERREDEESTKRTD